ncbi:putative quinol monooxygenase [Agrobacterium pusense]|uniref:putative quinol monooxygenase n=1 Tax=Agrobacterium pusense TaxID=648995 RepID=UPI00160B7AEC|nr:putative quinol monooxygenase [Agrobacterium pusense]MBB2908338.1 quinol monooxygenase YgiN [Rhizobium sp. RAS22]UXT92786.1 antibiotic biosynthesis monooxygenase [Agrobacterium pusense]
MAELTNVAFFKAKPGRSKDLEEALLALVPPSRREAGSLRYEIHQSKDTPDDWMVIEDWRHASDFDYHMKTSYVIEFLGRVPELCVGDIEIRGFRQCSAPHD